MNLTVHCIVIKRQETFTERTKSEFIIRQGLFSFVKPVNRRLRRLQLKWKEEQFQEGSKLNGK